MIRELAIGAVAGALVATIATSGYLGARYDAKEADLKAQHAEVVQKAAQEREEAIAQARNTEREMRRQVAELDAQHQQELSDAREENDALRSDVESGARRLRILATRPASCPGVPDDTSSPGMGDGASVELSSSAQQAYHHLRQVITENERKLAACQDYVKSIQTSN